MIIKGKSRADPVGLAKHLSNAETNEKISLFELRGVVADNLRDALVEMDAFAAGTRCEKPLYHAAISPAPPHKLTDRQIDIAVNSLELELGLVGHARAIVIHEKLGREHIHIVWSRIDLDRMKAVSDSHNYRKHETVARELERQFDHERTQGAHIEREGVDRPDRTPSRAELRQQDRTGIRISDVKRDITEAFQRSDTAPAFQTAIEEMGYILAQGDRRDFVIVDHAGGIHSLAKRIEGMRTGPLREFMSSVDRTAFPSVEQAVQAQNERDAAAVYRAYMEGYVQPETQYRRPVEQQALDETLLEKGYSKGDGYVSQSSEALQHHKRRQAALDAQADSGLHERKEEEVLRRQADDTTKRQEAQTEARSPSPDSSAKDDGVEMTDAKREALSRKAEKSVWREVTDDWEDDPDRQREAPGGGRTRSR